MNYYLQVLKKYATFEGRARRAEYWQFALIHGIISIVLNALTLAGEGFAVLFFVYAIGVLLPGLAVQVRRLHDVGKSGWFLLISLIPIVGAIWLLVLQCKDGDMGRNNYGENPKGGSYGSAHRNI